MGGNLLDYIGNLSTPTASVNTEKCFLGSVISTPKARSLIADIKHFYLNDHLPETEYLKLHISAIPDEIIAAYNLQTLQDEKGWCYIKLSKGMYGLKQAGIIANQELEQHMSAYGYRPVQFTPGLWEHENKETIFSLVVDEFLAQYSSEMDAENLLHALRQKYTITVNRKSKKYIGINLKWDYSKHTVELSMSEYVKNALHKFQHLLPCRPEHSPYVQNAPIYGRSIQYSDPEDSSDLLSPSNCNLIQQILGTFLYYGIALDNYLLVALNDISLEQYKATDNTSKKISKLLNYLATHPEAVIKYHASGLQLYVLSDSSYLSVSKSRSRAGGIHYLSDPPTNTQDPDNYTPLLHGIIYVVPKILCNIMSSAAEAELGALFLNGK